MTQPTRTKKHVKAHPMRTAGEWKAKFIESLKELYNVTLAAEAAGMSRRYVYKVKKEDPEFSQQWDEAWNTVVDSLEQAMMRRAVKGYMEPVYQNGQLMGHKVVHHPATGIFMLKHNRPEKYAEPLAGGANTPADYVKAVQQAFDEQDKLAEEALKKAQK